VVAPAIVDETLNVILDEFCPEIVPPVMVATEASRSRGMWRVRISVSRMDPVARGVIESL
jgi:hypothetical protein